MQVTLFLEYIMFGGHDARPPGCESQACLQVVDDWTSRSFRLLALAVGTIKNFSRLNVNTLTLQQAEAAASHMSLLGVMVVTNQLRADSRDTISQLQDEYVTTIMD